MDLDKELSISFDFSDYLDSGADIQPPSSDDLESDPAEPANAELKKSQGNSIGARIQALTLFEAQVPHEKIID